MNANLIRLLAKILGAYTFFGYRTSRYEWTLRAEQSLRSTWDIERPTVFTFWHDEFLVLGLNAFCSRIQFPVCVANDAFGGRVVARAWQAQGAPFLILKRAESREQRVERARQALVSGRRLAIAADYGTPWFKARPTAQRLAAATEGYVIAMHLHCRRQLVVGRRGWRVRVPTPFNHYTLHLSNPMNAHSADPDAVAAALWALRRAARKPSKTDAAVRADPDAPSDRTCAALVDG